MKNQLQVFINQHFGEVRMVKLNNKVYAVAKDIAKSLGYKNTNDAISRHCKGVVKHESLKINGSQISLIPQSDIIRLAIKCPLEGADEFEKWIFEEVIPQVLNTGSFDMNENKLQEIEDDKERELNLSIYTLEKALKINPNDLLTTLAYNNTKQELNTYLSNKKIDEVNNKIIALEEDFNKTSEQLKKTTVLREGDMSAEVIAKRFNIFSTTDRPHNRFADLFAKNLGFYIHPEGNSGYQDDLISINLENKYGKTTAVIKYSQLAFEEMNTYIEENGLKFEEPPIKYVRGNKKGQFNYAYLLFENGEHIKVNETTYKLYSKYYKEDF